jgi:hypothetical protein
VPRVVALVPKEKHISKFAFRLISQIGINYRDSALSRDASDGSFPANAPRPGDRLPFVMFQEGNRLVNIQDKVKTPALHLLLFSGDIQPDEQNVEAIRRVASQYDVIQTEILPPASAAGDLYKIFGIQNKGFYLVRPDMYIGCRSSRLEAEYLDNYLARIFKG